MGLRQKRGYSLYLDYSDLVHAEPPLAAEGFLGWIARQSVV